jgi:sensor histidine kinase regulating citrate/malate metabolism
MSTRAKIQAEEIAIIPVLRENVARKDISAITHFMHKIAARSDASFIVVGDNQGVICFIRRSPTGSALCSSAVITRRC